jgi:hypothetical protein
VHEFKVRDGSRVVPDGPEQEVRVQSGIHRTSEPLLADLQRLFGASAFGDFGRQCVDGLLELTGALLYL